MSSVTKYLKAREARLTGIETEGDLAGELVCPQIYLWKINPEGKKTDAMYKVAHDTEILVEKKKVAPIGDTFYYVRCKEVRHVRGWVTERFINWSNLSNGVSQESEETPLPSE